MLSGAPSTATSIPLCLSSYLVHKSLRLWIPLTYVVVHVSDLTDGAIHTPPFHKNAFIGCPVLQLEATHLATIRAPPHALEIDALHGHNLLLDETLAHTSVTLLLHDSLLDVGTVLHRGREAYVTAPECRERST